jgi:hypothetical protein
VIAPKTECLVEDLADEGARAARGPKELTHSFGRRPMLRSQSKRARVASPSRRVPPSPQLCLRIASTVVSDVLTARRPRDEPIGNLRGLVRRMPLIGERSDDGLPSPPLADRRNEFRRRPVGGRDVKLIGVVPRHYPTVDKRLAKRAN